VALNSTTHKLIETPYWWESGNPLPELPTEPPAKAELLIVGASIPGQGASTRNGGMLGAHPRVGFDTLSKHFGAEAATGIFNEAKDAFEFTTELIRRENIDCHFEQCGRIQMAWTRAHFEAQRKQVDQLRATTSMNLELLSREQLKDDINTPCYFGAIRFPEHASVQPRQMHDGMMSAVLRRGITVVQQCVIESIQQQSAGFIATTETGKTIHCDKVLMATNGYTQGNFGWFRQRVFPLPSFLIATEPLSANLIESLAPGRRMMVETRARYSYFRVAPDGSRIVFGGRASMRPITAAAAARRLRQTLSDVWPELADVAITHSWFGNTGYSFTHMPQVGTHNGMYFAMGYSGSGVAVAPYLGAKAGLLALGDDRGKTAYQQAVMSRRWFHRSSTPHFLKPASWWYHNVVDRAQKWQSARDHKQ